MRCDFISNQTPANAVTDHQYINVGRGSFTSVVGYMCSSSPTFPPFFYTLNYIHIYTSLITRVKTNKQKKKKNKKRKTCRRIQRKNAESKRSHVVLRESRPLLHNGFNVDKEPVYFSREASFPI